MDFSLGAVLYAFGLGITFAVATQFVCKDKTLCVFATGVITGIAALVLYFYLYLELPLHRYDTSTQKLVCTTLSYPSISL